MFVGGHGVWCTYKEVRSTPVCNMSIGSEMVIGNHLCNGEPKQGGLFLL